jgi:hypothetical protein
MYNRKNALILGAGSTAAVLAQSASADLPAGVGTAITAIQTDALAMVDLAWPVVSAIAVAFILFKIFKRVVSKV